MHVKEQSSAKETQRSETRGCKLLQYPRREWHVKAWEDRGITTNKVWAEESKESKEKKGHKQIAGCRSRGDCAVAQRRGLFE